MRALIITCMVATAFAVPQGYNYPQQNSLNIGLPQIGSIGTSSSHSSHSSSSSSAHSSGSVIQDGPNFLQEALQNTKLMQMLLSERPSSSYLAPQVSHVQQPIQQNLGIPQRQSFGFSQPQQFYQAPLQQQQQTFQQQNYNRPVGPPVVTKDIYVHVAPPEEDHYSQPRPQLPPPPPRKHYRIVFIKAPAPSYSKAALQINQAPTEEKTIIYVLTKKPDPIDLEAAIQESQQKPPSKPEVYFIKYKTQEEAQHAQRTIQAQYDKLGGTTQISDEGVAPVTSVIGALDHQQQGGANLAIGGGFSSSGSGSGFSSVGAIGIGGGSNGGGSSKYLPPIVRA